MRFTRIVPLLPLASAFVITDAEVFQNLEKSGKSLVDNAQTVLDNTQNVLDDAFGRVKDGAKDLYSKIHKAGYDVESWLEDSSFDHSVVDFEEDPHHPKHPPHHGPPHDGPPHHGKPRHPPHEDKPNRTVYELINESKYTTKLAKLINEYDDLVEILNGTKANYTIFAPTDEAFAKIPNYGKKPSKEVLKDILLYHISGDFYPGPRIFHSYTIPTLDEPEKLGHKQRLTVRVGFKGFVLNFYSRVVAANIFGTNGVIHGIDSILVPPPNVASIIELLPGEFSTLALGLTKTGLFDKLNSTDSPHKGGTVFAPSNYAFQKLGHRANAFLFSKYGEKYLRALLEYHIVVNQTLYSDAFYDSNKDDSEEVATHPPHLHYDLPTVLHDKYLSVDVIRYGPWVSIEVNRFAKVSSNDGVASDGVIQVVSDVLIPPRNTNGEQAFWQGEELSVDEIKERLQPFVDENIEL
ncbi:FAS1 domain-containing protein [Cucurbitaria berberidis CBS 394.84]|uniref:FAS1 domain-containing protein n=1 Tax=Cucurbitaria berberidis CBS 394.84 TaxID=1168544 RepID=A0A9P4LF71_9PLEO|nr:FAS1 domain-containing protein [Cucurbitaria berberidis CBS 394.84]KAF1851779.1 FAS1 domain-containing protein [Cucurbitaria berberidis CBS 394.84]